MNDREKTIKVWTSKIVYQSYDIVVNEDVWEELGADEKLPFIIKEMKHQVTLDDDEQIEDIVED